MGKSIIDQVREERDQQDAEAAARSRYAQRIHAWKGQGYNVARLVRAMDADPATVDRTFAQYEADVRTLWTMGQKVQQLDLGGMEHAYRQLMALLLDPDRIAEATTALAQLEQAVKDRQAQRQKAAAEEQLRAAEAAKAADIQRIIADLRGRGYVTTRLEQALRAGGPAKARETLPGFKTDLNTCWNRLQELQRLNVSKHREQARAVEALLRDPDRLPEAVKGLEALKAAISAAHGEQGLLWTPEQQAAHQQSQQADLRAQQQAAVEAADPTEAMRQAILDARVWLGALAEQQQGRPPPYSPAGYWLADRRWSVVRDLERMEVVGKVDLGFLKEHLVVRTSWADPAYFSTAKGAETYLAWAAEQYQSKGLYGVECFVVPKADPQVVSLISSWQHPCMGAFLYDSGADALTGNAKAERVAFFRPWFVLDSKPHTTIELLASLEDSNGIFYEKDLRERLGLRDEEIRRMFKALQKDNTIFQVSGTDGSWSMA